MIPAAEALERLHLGNRRFVSDACERVAAATASTRAHLIERQQPFAIVLGCSDSRVPPEILFDQGLGDLFVIRIAGNIVSRTQLGSIEYVTAHLGVRLIVVLGHSNCGAIQAALEALENPNGIRSSNIDSILDLIFPVLEPLAARGPGHHRETVLRQAVRANVLASISRIQNGSTIIETLVRDEGLRIVGADYSLVSGEVDFFDGLPLAE